MANSVFGRYDAVLVITAKDMEELSKTIYDVVETHPNVERTECLISVPTTLEPEEVAASRSAQSSETYSVISFQCPSCNLLNARGSVFCQFCGYIFDEPRRAVQK